MRHRLRTRRFLNIQGYSGNAFISAAVEDSTNHKKGEHGWPWSNIELVLSDCSRVISLDFPLDTPGERRNSLRKIAILVDTLAEFQAALEAEAELAEKRMPRGHRERDFFLS